MDVIINVCGIIDAVYFVSMSFILDTALGSSIGFTTVLGSFFTFR